MRAHPKNISRVSHIMTTILEATMIMEEYIETKEYKAVILSRTCKEVIRILTKVCKEGIHILTKECKEGIHILTKVCKEGTHILTKATMVSQVTSNPPMIKAMNKRLLSTVKCLLIHRTASQSPLRQPSMATFRHRSVDNGTTRKIKKSRGSHGLTYR